MTSKEDPPQPVHSTDEGWTQAEVDADQKGNAQWREFGTTDQWQKEIQEAKEDTQTRELAEQRDEVERTEEE